MTWKSGLFGCFGNIGLSVIACCAFPLAVGKNAEAVGENNPVLWVLAVSAAPCIAGALLRGLIRKKKVDVKIHRYAAGQCLAIFYCSSHLDNFYKLAHFRRMISVNIKQVSQVIA